MDQRRNILEDKQTGERAYWPQGVSFDGKRWRYVGLEIDPVREAQKEARQLANTEDAKNLAQLARERGIGVGDLIEQGIKALGLDKLVGTDGKPCADCEKRKAFFNHMRLHGWKITWEKN